MKCEAQGNALEGFGIKTLADPKAPHRPRADPHKAKLFSLALRAHRFAKGHCTEHLFAQEGFR